MTVREKSFSVTSPKGTELTLENLWAEVHVSVGDSGEVLVSMDGSEKLLDEIEISESNRGINIKGKGGHTDDISIVTGSGSISIGGSISGGVIMTGGGGSIQVNTGRGRGKPLVIIDGEVVSGGDSNDDPDGNGKPPTIHIKVPPRTPLIVDRVYKLTAREVGGSLDATLGGSDILDVQHVEGLKIRTKGQSECYVDQIKGDAVFRTSGQSEVRATGRLGNIELNSSGQSEIDITGSCNDLDARSSGQSEIRFYGRPNGRVRQRESGQSSISIRG